VKKHYLILLLLLFSLVGKSQTFIEMISPQDADIILFEVDKKEKADIVIFSTNNTRLAKQWDCHWKFKKWGFSNFSIYIAKDSLELYVKNDNDSVVFIPPTGKIYFTSNPKDRGYIDPDFRLPNLMRKLK